MDANLSARDTFVDELRRLYGAGLKERENDLARYDRYLSVMRAGPGLAGLVEEVLARRPVARLLDVGCGDAGALSAVASRFPGRLDAVGIDLVSVDHAPRDVDVHVGDALELPFPAERDLVVSFRSLHEIGRLPRLIPKIARALAPGGRAFLSIRVAEERDGTIVAHGLIGGEDVTWLRGTLAASSLGDVRASGGETTAVARLRLPVAVANLPREADVPYVAGVNLLLLRPGA